MYQGSASLEPLSLNDSLPSMIISYHIYQSTRAYGAGHLDHIK